MYLSPQNSNAGFGLVEVMVASAIASALALVMATLFNNMKIESATVKFNNEANVLHEEIRTVLGNSTACLNTFGGQALTVGMNVTIPNIRNAGGTVVYASGPTNYGDNSLRIQSMTLDTYADTIPIPTGEVTLNINFAPLSQTIGSQVLSRTIRIQTSKNGANQLNGCIALARMTDGLWRRVSAASNDIFYTPGFVGIGTSTPLFPLDILGGVVRVRNPANGTGGTYSEINTDGGIRLRRPTNATTGFTNGYIDFLGSNPASYGRIEYDEAAKRFTVSSTVPGLPTLAFRNWNPSNGTGGTFSSINADGTLHLRRPTDATAGQVNGAIDFQGSSATKTARIEYNEVASVLELNTFDIPTGNLGGGINFRVSDRAHGTGGTYTFVMPGGIELRRPTDASFGNINGFIDFQGDSSIDYGRIYYSEASKAMVFVNNTSDLQTIVGASSAYYPFQVNGRAANTTGVWGVVSDRRLKKDIEKVTNALESVLKLEAVRFHWKDPKMDRNEGEQVGFIAQDVEKIFPNWVRKNSDGYKTLEKVGVEAIFSQAIKEFYNLWVANNEAVQQELEQLRLENVETKRQLEEFKRETNRRMEALELECKRNRKEE